jgi:arylsulfatase A-like enzyme
MRLIDSNVLTSVFRRRLIIFWSLGLVIWCFNFAVAANPKNILLIIADDYGIDSSSLYNTTNTGAKLPPTPNIVSLARNGVIFSRAYANPVCSPTRACLLTGQFGFRTGMGDIVDNGSPLPTNAYTLPRMFATNSTLNYNVMQFGKWHLAFGPNTPRTIGGWTNFSGFLAGAVASYTNWTKVINGTQFPGTTNYTTLDIMQDATNWIGTRGTNLWFAWVAFNAPHTPLHLPPTNLCPHYANLSGTASDIAANPANYFDAMMEAGDTAIGNILSWVNLTNTYVIFLGDNGTANTTIQPPFTNTRAKDTLYEGGTHVPLVIAGPVFLPNRTNATPVSMVDVFATILEMAGIDVSSIPTNSPVDGQSLFSVLQATNLTLSRYAYSELFGTNALTIANGGRALRSARYTLLDFTSKADEFYDFSVDPYEKTNLLATTMSATQSGNYYSLVLKLGDYQASLTRPVISGFGRSNLQFSVNVQRNLTNSYSLWRASALDGLDWSPLTNVLVITNSASSVTLTDTNAVTTQNFYRVMAQ